MLVLMRSACLRRQAPQALVPRSTLAMMINCSECDDEISDREPKMTFRNCAACMHDHMHRGVQMLSDRLHEMDICCKAAQL